MKNAIYLTIVFVSVILMTAIAQDGQPTQPAMPAGMTGGYETVQSKILKVYSAEDNGAQFRAYVVKWKDSEVIVSDMLGKTNKKEGDTITFMAQRMEMPQGGEKIKMLQFMILELPSFPK